MALLVFMTLPGPLVPPTVPAAGPTPPHRPSVDPGAGPLGA
jgi:hypothetical protein